MGRSRVLSILDGSNTAGFARGEIWVSAEALGGLGLSNDTSGIVALARVLGADICFLSCQGPQAVSTQAEALRGAVRKVHPADLACGAVVDGPWGRLSRREGVLSLLSGLRDGSRIARELAVEADFALGECEAWIEAGADLVLLADDLAHSAGPYFSPALFSQLILPLYQQLLSKAGRGVPVGFHSDGDITLLLPGLVSAGFSSFSLEPEAVSLAGFRARYGRKITLISGIRAAWLDNGHPGGIASADLSAGLAEVTGVGSLILASACGLSTPGSVTALKELYRMADGLK